MLPASQAQPSSSSLSTPLCTLLPRRAFFGGLLALLTACSGTSDLLNSYPPPPGRRQQPAAIGTGAVKVGLILPLSAGGNAGTVAQSMKNAAEMALAEFNSPNVQLLVKDDGGTPGGAQQAAQQALAEGAEIIIGPLFAHSVGVVGAAARQRGVPVIAFSTDASVAARGVYLLSFLPESDVDRIVDYAIASGKRSFAAMLSEGAYGNVVEGEFKQVVARKGGRIVALERYALDPARMQAPAKLVAQAARGADAVFIPEGPEVVPSVVQALIAPASTPSASSSSAPACGTTRASSMTRGCRAAGMPRPTAPASAISPPAIASATTRTRCARRRWPMTRWRWWRRWSRRKARSASPNRC